MSYSNQLILTGEINDVGEYTRQNVSHSVREGVEIEGAWTINDKLKLYANATISQNKIDHFEEFIDNYDDYTQIKNSYDNTTISFSPEFISAGSIIWMPVKKLEFEFTGKYVGKQFLDNTMNADRIIDAYMVNDARISYSIQTKAKQEIGFTFAANNIFNQSYVSNGYTYSYIYGGTQSTFNNYFPQAGTTVMFGLKIRM